ncbi:GreA/GreB family elongation factor [Metallibacterium scheffleri]
MSRAFTKESDAPEALPERTLSEHRNYVTASGLAQLRARATTVRNELQAAQTRADAAVALVLARDLRWLDTRIAAAIVVNPAAQPPERVAFGAVVTVEDAAGATQRWQIVGEDEADASAGKVSWVSPLARALLDAQVGDEVTWRRPAGAQTLTVTHIEYPR